MVIKEPTSMSECAFFTRRTIGAQGKIAAWVLRSQCPQCKQAMMGKPKDSKTGKVKIRAKEYVCPGCSYTVDEHTHEQALTITIKYTCQHCGQEGSTQQPFHFKKSKIDDPHNPGEKKTAKLIRFQCEHCQQSVDLIKVK